VRGGLDPQIRDHGSSVSGQTDGTVTGRHSRIEKIHSGAGGGIRTHDLTITNRLRYQTAPHRLGSPRLVKIALSQYVG
jgi:hypothetical protein